MRLSLITVNLNNVCGLQKTIDSVLSQTWREYEWILIDGGSSDGSVDIIEQNKDSFSYYCSEPDGGIYNAMNKGIIHSHGDYCLFLNSGDYLCSADTLEKAFGKIIDADIITFDMIKEGANPVEYVTKYNEASLTAYCLIQGTLPHQATLIRRQLFQSYGLYDETLKIVSDWKFFLETLVLHHATFCYYSMPLTCVQPDGISSRNDELRESERKQVLSSYFPERILQDYQRLYTLTYVQNTSWLCRRLFGLLFRFASFTRKCYR